MPDCETAVGLDTVGVDERSVHDIDGSTVEEHAQTPGLDVVIVVINPFTRGFSTSPTNPTTRDHAVTSTPVTKG